MPDLPSWRDTPTRRAILDLVAAVATGPDALPPAERVAVLDNDGTLWTEKPLPVQLHFLVAQWAQAAANDPALAESQPYRAAATGDLAWLGGAVDKHYAGDDTDLRLLIEAVVAAQAGRSVGTYADSVRAFLDEATHPALGTPYRYATYQPMRELLDLLRAHGFSTYITSGGDRDFMRPFTEDYYGVAPEQVVGSSLGLSYDDETDDVVYGSSFSFMDDGPEKPVRIWSRIGRRPVLAVGNSNGDVPMLAYAAGHPRGMAVLIRHDDPDRGDLPYDKGADQALIAAADRGWTVVSVRDDWSQVFPTAPGTAQGIAPVSTAGTAPRVPEARGR
ncbi:HAD family hydrolase [Oerskovia jenensis]|uniref:Phosphoserine phosphatase n=1 Tax=Oerskovia jenensis TaxID=162169 RepID=A0ABS2LGF6_9CELL|nr:HAD family hydrolase [Oerskovia jenensis]MBM7479511.1 phosphoserine phosphatase [Oerskovia jenensis]